MKIGVFGLGYMGSTHLKAYQTIPQAEIAAVFSRNPKRLAGDFSDIRGNIGAPGERIDLSAAAKYTDAYEALGNPALEAVDLCLPTYLHAPVAVAALKAGKHVLVEKPLALTGDEAGQMIAVAQENGRVLMAAHLLRFMPQYRVVARMIRANELGPVRAAILWRRSGAPGWSEWLTDKEKSGGGILDLLIHDVDFCLHAFGAPQAVSATGYEDLARGTDWITATIEYPNIGAVMISGGWHPPKGFPFAMEYTIACERGTLDFSSAGTPLTLYGMDGRPQLIDVPKEDGFRVELEYFIDCSIRGVKPELCPPEESAAAVRLARLMQESRARNGEKLQFS